MRATRGFTLVEILIVVVILGILAAIVIPQFTEASTEARESSLVSDLQSLRSQIELYKAQHYDIPPAAGGTDATLFENQMIYCSDKEGTVNPALTRVRSTLYPLGPYMERLPENPFADDGDPLVAVVNAEFTDAGRGGTGTASWLYSSLTGEIYPDDTFDMKPKDGTPDHIGF
jgi:general secretion pathway protein G